MSQEKLELSFWDKLGDVFSSIGEGVSRFLARMLGSSSEQYVRKLGYMRPSAPGAVHKVFPGSLLAQVNELEEKMRALSDEQLRELTPAFRQRLHNGARLDSLLPEAFAACREAARR